MSTPTTMNDTSSPPQGKKLNIFLPENLTREQCEKYAYATTAESSGQISLFTAYPFEPEKQQLIRDYNNDMKTIGNPSSAVTSPDSTPVITTPSQLDAKYRERSAILNPTAYPDLSTQKIKLYPGLLGEPKTATQVSSVQGNFISNEQSSLLAHLGTLFMKALVSKTYCTARANGEDAISKDDLNTVLKTTPQLQFLRPTKLKDNTPNNQIIDTIFTPYDNQVHQDKLSDGINNQLYTQIIDY